jgi:ADP-heptose:LPS heptosyltransferase
MNHKILIIRFSSIGDIVLTSALVRCVKQQLLNAEVHFICKKAFFPVLAHNPHVDKLHVFEKDVSELMPTLKSENFETVIDLHHNLRSLRLKMALGVKSFSFPKLNLQKFLAVSFKSTDLLPDVHIVDRYFETVANLGVKNDGGGLDYFISENDTFNIEEKFQLEHGQSFISLVAGGSYFTKQIPIKKLREICLKINKAIIILGGKEDVATARQLETEFSHVKSACGVLSLNQSAYVIKCSEAVITSDTGLMHIAAAFRKKIYSLWGNTIPEFGMHPYLPHPDSKILEVKNLSCRPCSKLGFKKCPKGHFKCMEEIDVNQINL